MEKNGSQIEAEITRAATYLAVRPGGYVGVGDVLEWLSYAMDGGCTIEEMKLALHGMVERGTIQVNVAGGLVIRVP